MMLFAFKYRAAVGFSQVFILSQLAAQVVSNRPSTSPPLPPAPKPFTQVFRNLLVASPQEKETLLAGRTAESREVLEKKLQEYKSLPEPECELRLRTLDLRWYLSVLIPLNPSNRVDWLARISENDRGLVEDRLKQWDQLPADWQRELRDNQQAIVILSAVDSGALPKLPPPANLSPQEKQIESAISRWKKLTPDKRAQIYSHFQKIYVIDDAPAGTSTESTTALKRRKLTERREVLTALLALPKDQRDYCLRSFKKFTAMSSQQRAIFLKNAARWQRMSRDDRQAWRALTRVTPPRPPKTYPFLPPPPLPLVGTNK